MEPLAERLAVAVRLREDGRVEEALALLLSLRAEAPTDARVALQTAWAHDTLGHEEEAVEHYRAALAGELPDEELRGALLGLGSTLRALGQDDEAERVLADGVARFPDFRPLRVFHALALDSCGRSREALRAVLEVLLETTDDPAVAGYRRSLGAYAADLDRSWLA